jgi:aldose 1-epimerase
MPAITLRRGDLEVVADPARGGAILAFRRAGVDLLRPWDGRSDNPRSYACFPRVPVSGRVDRGRFIVEGREHRLPLNAPPGPHAVHGEGWQLPWRLGAEDAASTTFVLDRDDPATTFRYRAELRYAVADDTFEVALAVTHRGDVPMPYGLGLHPYFPRRPGTLVSAEVAGVWMPDESNIPRELAPVPIGWGFRLRRDVNELEGLDHNFQGWSGTARVEAPEQGTSVTIEADEPFRHLVLYVPPGQDYFCLEPVSHVADGFNMLPRGVEGTGVRVLGPGERLAGTVRFRTRT